MRQCSVDGCERSVDARGMCSGHYARFRRYGDPLAGGPSRDRSADGAACSIEGCGKPRYGRGLCQMHWQRWWKHGDPLVNLGAVRLPIDRLLDMVDVQPDDGCWLQRPSGLNGQGYGKIEVGSTLDGTVQTRPSHVVSWEWFNQQPVPEGYEVHHVCEVRNCINPAHLLALTPAGHRAVHAKTHCIHGHEFTPENAHVNAKGWRQCRACRRERYAESAGSRRAST